ncbi:hypothetical protein QFZ97_003917 [Paraburkholderia youngii]
MCTKNLSKLSKPAKQFLRVFWVVLLVGCVQIMRVECGPGALATIAQRIGSTTSSPVQSLTCERATQ